jgi:hypothetical protein
MRRVLVFALVVWLGHTSAAAAGETLLASASRIALEAARAQAPPPPQPASVATPRGTFVHAHQEQPSLALSRMSKRKKLMIWLAAGVGFAVTAYAIDHSVQDNTPSTLGTRKD